MYIHRARHAFDKEAHSAVLTLGIAQVAGELVALRFVLRPDGTPSTDIRLRSIKSSNLGAFVLDEGERGERADELDGLSLAELATLPLKLPTVAGGLMQCEVRIAGPCTFHTLAVVHPSDQRPAAPPAYRWELVPVAAHAGADPFGGIGGRPEALGLLGHPPWRPR